MKSLPLIIAAATVALVALEALRGPITRWMVRRAHKDIFGGGPGERVDAASGPASSVSPNTEPGSPPFSDRTTNGALLDRSRVRIEGHGTGRGGLTLIVRNGFHEVSRPWGSAVESRDCARLRYESDTDNRARGRDVDTADASGSNTIDKGSR